MSAAPAPHAARTPAPGRWARRIVRSCLALVLAGPAAAQTEPAPVADPTLVARVTVHPGASELGRVVTYRADLNRRASGYVRLLPVAAEGALTWGTPRVYLRDGSRRRLDRDPYAKHRFAELDTMAIEVPLQVFALGEVEVPGPSLEIDQGGGQRIVRLPAVSLTIAPVLTAADSNADFRGLHGPLGAPWWERVPWLWVAGALALIAALVAWRLSRRARRARSAPAPVPAVTVAIDPLAEALAALAALRELKLPEQGRFAEHAFRLGQILRRYLEGVLGLVRPGDTTPELIGHLRHAGIDGEQIAPLSGLLRAWDQVKFAREPYTREQAAYAEGAVEAHLKRPAPPPGQRVA